MRILLQKAFLTFFYLAMAIVFFCISALAQTLDVSPADSLVDDILFIRVSALKPGQPVIIRAASQDTAGKAWQSYAGFYADKNGKVDLAIHKPAHGTYSGVNPMGLIQSMNVPGADYNRVRFATKGIEPLNFTFSLEIDGKNAGSTTVTRRFLKPSAKITDVRENGLIGKLFAPGETGSFPAVIVLGGSEGGLSSEDVAAMLSNHGFAALALAYFGTEGLPQSLEEIPLEYFKKAVDWLEKQPFVSENGVAILGTSKGAEAALLVASKYRQVKAVVAYAPSSVAWSCICADRAKSSWSFVGKSVPSISFAADPAYSPPQGFPVSPAVNYRYRLNKAVNLQEAEIPVENINGPVLLISGGDDGIWMSAAMSEMIMKRLRQHNHRYPNKHLIYPSAGHLIGKGYLPSGSVLIANGRITTGGTPEGNAAAQKDAWPKVLEFFKRSNTKNRTFFATNYRSSYC